MLLFPLNDYSLCILRSSYQPPLQVQTTSSSKHHTHQNQQQHQQQHQHQQNHSNQITTTTTTTSTHTTTTTSSLYSFFHFFQIIFIFMFVTCCTARTFLEVATKTSPNNKFLTSKVFRSKLQTSSLSSGGGIQQHRSDNSRHISSSFIPSTNSVLFHKQQQQQQQQGRYRFHYQNTKMFSSTATNEEEQQERIKNSLLHCPTITLRNGLKHPVIGFGTYKVGYIPASASSATTTTTTTTESGSRSAEECITDAIQVGYRFFECAEFYGNEEQVGNAITKSGINRDEFFLCSKVWTTTIEQGSDAIRKQVDKTLQQLQTNYIDLYLIHWPVPYHHVNAYKTLIELQKEGKIRGIGVSNYAYEDYLELKNDPDISVDELPLVNQIEINPFLFRQNTIRLFQQEGVVLQSYRSLRDGKVMDHPLLLELGTKYMKTPAQILGNWCCQGKNFIYVPKSVKLHRMYENANVFDFIMEPNDIQKLDELTAIDAYQTYETLYRKCVNRDTSKDGTMDGVKLNITID